MTKAKNSPLSWAIESALLEARADQSNVTGKSPRKWRAVKGGLEIHLQFTERNILKLALARIGKMPDEEGKKKFIQELKTVLDYWPEENTSVTSEKKFSEMSARYWLIVELTIAKQTELI